MKLPRFMIAAPASGSGKTLVTCGILQLLKRRGMQVTSFKCGPDYIDPMFHSRVIGANSRNLDSFFADADTLRYLLAKNGEGSDIAVVEGVMGFYDGLAGSSPKASAWEIASLTDTPVLLLVNCKGLSLSVVPMIKGFLEYQKNSCIRGVILNQVSPMLYPRMKELIEEQLPVTVCGYVPQIPNCRLESRHLGLVMPHEIADLQLSLNQAADILENSLELERIFDIAESAGALTCERRKVQKHYPVRIGLATDEAFCFFYEDNLQLLRDMGAELVPFSPLHDVQLPQELDGLLLHGGYPELYAKELSDNFAMRCAIKEALSDGLVCMAECGGFMYLHEAMQGHDGFYYPMAGVISGTVHKTERLRRFGYISLTEGTAFGEPVGELRSHEFHYYDSENCGEDFLARKPLSSRQWRCIHSTKTLLAGYPHMYYYSNLQLPEAFLRACLERKGQE